MKRSALACFQRGFLSARANSGLIWMAVLQNFAVSVLFLLSLLPPFLVLGGMALFSESWSDLKDLSRIDAWFTDLPARLGGHLGALALGVLASLLIGLLVVVVWAWFQAGLVGILLTGERQAHPEAQLKAGGWRWFKTFSLSDFSGWGGRHLWRFFWFFHLMITAWMLIALVVVLLMAGLGVAWQSWGGGAAVGLGCGGSIPLVFLFWVLAAWSLLAQPAVSLARGGAVRGAVRGSVLGFHILGRRLGAASLLLLATLVLSLLLGLILGLGRTIFDLLFAERFALRMGVLAISTVVQWVLASAINVWVLGGYTALVAADPEAGEG